MKMTSSTLPITGSLSKASAPDAMSYEAAMGVIETLKALNESLKDDYDKLAVECAALNSFIERECWRFDDIEDSYVDAWQSSPETPVTDAAIAEVRAQGVDLSSNELKALAERSRKEAPVSAEHIHSAALYLMIIAAELRAGMKP